MATKLGLFNAALIELGDKTLSDTGEAVEAGRILNTVYSDVVNDCLADGPWNFAAVNYTADGDTGLINPGTVGYNYGYSKPSDWVRTIVVSDDQHLVFPLTQYFDSQEIWAADTGTIFTRYVSSDTGTGLDITNWPITFRRYVELSLADRIAYRVAQDKELRKDISERRAASLATALEQNVADAGAVRYAPDGSWQAFYQEILTELGEDLLLTERSGQSRRVIEDVLAETKLDCLTDSDWGFATKTIQPTPNQADTGILAGGGIGYVWGYAKPTDWLRTVVVSDDPYAVFPLTQFYDGNNYWAADTGVITVRYIANDTGTGLNTSEWPPAFRRYLALETAVRIYKRLVEKPKDLTEGSSQVSLTAAAEVYELEFKALIEKRDQAKEKALSQNITDNAMPRYAPDGSWQAFYQEILTELGDDTLLFTRSGPGRRAIEDVLEETKFDCLTETDWNFATKTIQPTASADTGLLAGGGVGYVWGYAKPTDWLKTVMVSDDPYAVFPLTQYYDGPNYWSADTGVITVRYIANDTGTGLNVSEWPPAFRRYLTLEVASRIFRRLADDTNPESFKANEDKYGTLLAKRDAAKGKALDQNTSDAAAPRYAPDGSWQEFYQEILTELGDDSLLSTRSGTARRAIEDVLAEAKLDCLTVTDWNFATKTIQPTAVSSDTGLLAGGGIGYTWGYAKPTDWLRTVVVSDDPHAVFPLTQFYDGNNYWAADTGMITVRYIANDTGTGLNVSEWPPAFRRLLTLETAVRVSPRLVNADKESGELVKAEYDALVARRDAAIEKAVTQNVTDAAAPRFAPTASWQALYQQALTDLGDVTLLTTRSGEARRALDDVYDEAVQQCLEAGAWNFAIETIKATADTGITPEFGFREVFAKPTDFLRTLAVSEDEYFTNPLTEYYDDINFWSADYDPIYIRYVSHDTGMGLEKSRWPANFKRYVELELATRVCLRLTKDSKLLVDLEERRTSARRRALNLDSMNEKQPKFAPEGSWGMARGGRYGGRRDRGSRSNLTG